MYFSVIIPMFNKENHIERAINSVLNQENQRFEIIIVDDGSTDKSVEAVKNMLDTNVLLIEQNNHGVSSARNTGIDNASYDYVCFLDADDAWKSTFLKVAENLIEKYPGAGIYGTSYELVNQQGETTTRTIKSSIQENESQVINYFKESLDKKPILSASSVVVPKYVFKELGGFPLGISKGEDQDMWSRIALNFPVIFMNQICAIYYLNADNRTSNTKADYSKSFMSYAEDVLIKEKRKGIVDIYFEEYMIMHIMKKVRSLINQRKLREARKLLFKYKYTQFNREEWIKNYILTFKPLYALYKRLR